MADRATPDFTTVPLQSEREIGTRETWEEMARTELGTPLETTIWHTPEGIEIDPIFSADDLAIVDHFGSLPGVPPFVRGP